MFKKHKISGLNANDFAEKLDKLSPADLKYVEKDLSKRDKVSLAFLLFGNEINTARFILQRLLVLYRNQFEDSDILQRYAEFNQQWRKFLMEALTLMNSRKVIRKLGFDFETLKELFLPQISQTSLGINLILKNLYIICERMTMAEGGQLVQSISPDNDSFSFFDYSYLEIYMLHWISESKITVNPPNLDVLIQFFKSKENDSLKELLIDAVKYSTIVIPTNPTKESLNSKSKKNTAVDDIQHENKLTGEGDRQPNSIKPLDEEEGVYRVRKDTAGFLLVINQKNFYRDLDEDFKEYLSQHTLQDRQGTDKDRDRLIEVFKQFGYRPQVRENLRHDEFIDEIDQFIGRSLLFDSLIICILSHGIKDHVYGSNSIPVNIEKIKDRMKDPRLAGKPKVLLIQACQGTEKQELFPIEHDGPMKGVPTEQDILVGLSTVPGFASFRHVENGSWYIQTICRKVEELGNKKHFHDILTAVNRDISKRRSLENNCMTSIVLTTLTKEFYLPRSF